MCIYHLFPQTWHIPSRVDGIEPKAVLDVTVQKVISPQAKSDRKRKKVSGVTSTVFKPFQQPLSTLNMANVLRPLFENLTPRPGFLRIWPDEDEDVEMTESKFGLVPKGSVLAYQQALPTSIPKPDPNICPEFPFPKLFYPDTVLAEKEMLFYDSLTVTRIQSSEYEAQTREQSRSKDWHRLRRMRITASNFKRVCSRRKDHEALSFMLAQGKTIQTASMKYGIDHEDEAAQQYSQHFGRDVYSVGLVINPSVPHLACSPDRRVYDATEEDPWGLLEIKSSMADNLSELNYLKLHEQNGKYSLKKSHAYYYQVMGCMGLTGSKWEDFYVSCKQEFHFERVYFDADFFSNMLDKLNLCYFSFHLYSFVKMRKQ